MTLVLALACNNGCSSPPAELDTGILDTASLDHDDLTLYSGDWSIPDPEETMAVLEALPPASDGAGYQLLNAPDGEFVLRPEQKGPLTGAAGCAALFMACWDPQHRSAAACFAKVPVCTTDEPWLEDAYCCPTSCGARFAELRAQGLRVTRAVPETLFLQGSCVPGIDEMLEDGQ